MRCLPPSGLKRHLKRVKVVAGYSRRCCGCAGSSTKQRRPNARHVSRSSNELRLRIFSCQRSFL
ncbi:hypothetical protein HBI56_086140 [Parastagonospora nodorum]|uniref:Uncharacterized protein n=1 Tax=Phaeosphaeria nodorum (strain SN15 / ATCC MYA-4574 / FGSC 10173) TaxID=321614 RepID=A0A7U2FED7_PHANO|nr:hypothetical protein HBH56_113410 [Parastagonospora nodorum]QRD03583.1 hypothetical protein JI435_419880 [Parastagonospora nodorum SN15]KAH3921524.1 hypothetical protein HBH54_239010 [Parastagonospora nodorum]KAH3951062.1 hypothetical protein HBH53_069090 [Parastagonospora nodorum]KAH3963061.1 hypothetical protein HBH51_169760 [Parastagonospora nodorum]